MAINKKKTNIIISLKPQEQKLLVWKKLVMQEKENGKNTNASTLAKAALEYYITHGKFLQIGAIPKKLLENTDISDVKRTLSIYAPEGSTLRCYIDNMLQKKVNFKTTIFKGYLAASIIITDDDSIHIPTYDEIFPFIIGDGIPADIPVVETIPHRNAGKVEDIYPNADSSPIPVTKQNILSDSQTSKPDISITHAEFVSSKSYDEEGLSVKDASIKESDEPLDKNLLDNFMGLLHNNN